MKPLPLPGWIVLGAGVLHGVLGDVLLRGSEGPGLNLFTWIAVLAVTAVLLHRRAGAALSVESTACVAVGVLFAAVLLWRDAPLLKLAALATTGIAFSAAAFRAGAAWLRGSGVADYVMALGGAGLHGAVGAVRAVRAAEWGDVSRNTRGSPWFRHTVVAARGVALATPFVIVFGGLFIAADAVFARMVTDVLRIDLSVLASHIALASFLGWIAAGGLTGFLAGTRLPVVADAVPRGGMVGAPEIGTALSLIALLFAAFVVVQLRYLFGGADLVAVTPELTYAEYARRGFFELVTVVVLTLPLLLVADWALRRDRPKADRVFRVLAGTQIVLVMAVAASAVQRMRLYVAAYGLTELRLYASALLVLLGVILVWFAVTVLRGRRRSFGVGALAAATAAAAVLVVINPDALIARTNLARSLSAEVQPQLDVAYAASLSADAVPVLVAALPSLAPDAGCRIAQRVLRRWGPETSSDWRSWSWSQMRAREEIERNESMLRTAAARGCADAPAAAAQPAGGAGAY